MVPMAKSISFRAPIKATRGGGGAFVEVPFDVERTFGKKRVPICATIDGEAYRGSLVRMGGDCHMLLILKSIREKIGKGTGDSVSIKLSEDKATRTVRIPTDLRRALAAAPNAGKFFAELSFTHQREYVEWIGAAKQAETRERRVDRMIELLKRKKKERYA